jgi:hypothetical protein
LDPIQAISSFTNAHAKLILDTGKIVLALIMFFLSLVSLLIVINFAMLRRKLQAMELSAHQVREELVILFTQTRAGLKGLQDSLKGQTPSFDKHELLRSGGRVAMLLLSKERNVVAWGVLGFKMAGDTLRYLLSRR